MGKTGTYEINHGTQKNNSFCLFIGTLLKCLAVLLIIYTILVLCIHFNRKDDASTDSIYEKNGGNAALTELEKNKSSKENVSTSTPIIITPTKGSTATVRTSQQDSTTFKPISSTSKNHSNEESTTNDFLVFTDKVIHGKEKENVHLLPESYTTQTTETDVLTTGVQQYTSEERKHFTKERTTQTKSSSVTETNKEIIDINTEKIWSTTEENSPTTSQMFPVTKTKTSSTMEDYVTTEKENTTIVEMNTESTEYSLTEKTTVTQNFIYEKKNNTEIIWSTTEEKLPITSKKFTTTTDNGIGYHTKTNAEQGTSQQIPQTTVTVAQTTLKEYIPTQHFTTQTEYSTTEANLSKFPIMETQQTKKFLTTENENDIIVTTVGTKRNQEPDTSTLSSLTKLVSSLNPIMTTTLRKSSGVCKEKSCKKFASQMLYLRNYEADPCENFYKYACDEGDLDRKNYFEYISDNLLYYIHANDKEYLIHLKNFHRNCVEYNTDLSLKSRLNIIKSETANNNLTQMIVDGLLQQTNPFFDIGIRTGKSQNFELTIQVPGENLIKSWKFYKRIQKQCISKVKNIFAGQSISVKNISTSVKKCLLNGIEKYIIMFVDQFKIGQKKHVKQLMDILELQNGILNLSSEEIILNIKELNSRSDFVIGVNWIDVFNGIFSNNLRHNLNITLLEVEHLKHLFGKLRSMQSEDFIAILDLVSNMRIYSDIVMYPVERNLEKYCLKRALHVMPDIAAIAIDESITPSRKTITNDGVETLAKIVFNDLKRELEESLEESNFNREYVSTLVRKIKDINLETIQFSPKYYKKENYEGISTSSKDFPTNYLTLMKNHRKILYSHAGHPVSPEILLQYFLDMTSEQAVAFTPSNYIVFHKGFLYQASNKLPDDIIIAQIGYQLSQELLKYVDFEDKSDEDRLSILKNKTQENLNGIRNLILGESNYSYVDDYPKTTEAIILNGAFRLITDLYLNRPPLQEIIWLNEDYTTEQVFLLAVLQGQCKKNNYNDVIEDIVEGKLPTFIKMENIIRNSKFLSDQFSCKKKASSFIQFPEGGLQLL